jgi:hypothetical protein
MPHADTMETTGLGHRWQAHLARNDIDDLARGEHTPSQALHASHRTYVSGSAQCSAARTSTEGLNALVGPDSVGGALVISANSARLRECEFRARLDATCEYALRTVFRILHSKPFELYLRSMPAE